MRFIITGDTGTGTNQQSAVASAMKQVCDERKCQFALLAGDNIYEYGVSSNQDPQFQTKFEIPYSNLNFPFFIALGNHDQSGTIPGSGVYPSRGDLEVQYTPFSTRWMLPKRYYRFAAPVKNSADYTSSVAHPVIEFFVIDTNPLAPQNMPQFDWYKPHQSYDRQQRKWLREAIASSSAQWKVVLGHHPYRNNGVHGNAGQFKGIGLATGQELKAMYEQELCNKVDFLISGHDHSLQWLKPLPECGNRPQFIISGAGGKTNGPKQDDPSKRDNRAEWEIYHRLGFFWAEATSTQIRLIGYTVDPKGHPTLGIEKLIIR